MKQDNITVVYLYDGCLKNSDPGALKWCGQYCQNIFYFVLSKTSPLTKIHFESLAIHPPGKVLRY